MTRPIPYRLKRNFLVLLTLLWAFNAHSQSFIAPDTVCVGDPVNITHVPQGSTYFWNFCSGGFYSTPQVTNLGNPGGVLTSPVFMVTEKEGGNYYGFISNNDGRISKLNFGSSLLNTPAVVDWGSCNGVIPNHTEGLQLVKDVNGYHLLVVGGVNETLPQIVRVDLGPTLASNVTPNGVSWGNIGNLDYPTDLYVFNDNNHWYGFVTNWNNSTITRFDFGTDFSNPPTALNLGNIGSLNYPTGICALQENGKWYVCVINETGGTLTRLDFGNSLLNIPVAINMGDPDGAVLRPRDLTVIHDCGGTFGLVTNGPPYHELVKINFDGGIEGTVHGNDLGNIGNFDFPHSISTLFREGQNLYTFITNVGNHSLARAVFTSCTESSIPTSMAATPPAFSYNAPGVYNVNLLVDEALPTQSTYCKSIVVLDKPAPVLANKDVCNGDKVTLDATTAGTTNRYLWNNAATTSSISVGGGIYTVTVDNGGCTVQATATVTESPALVLDVTVQSLDCTQPSGTISLQASGGTAPYQYFVNELGTAPVATLPVTGLAAGAYTVYTSDAKGCKLPPAQYQVTDNTNLLKTSAVSTDPACYGNNNGSISINLDGGGAPPYSYSLNGGSFQSGNSWSNLAPGSYQLVTQANLCYDTLQVTLQSPAPISVNATTADENCGDGQGKANWQPRGGQSPYSYSWDGVSQVLPAITDQKAGTHQLHLADALGCSVDTLVTINNNTTSRIHILNEDTTINIGESVLLIAENNAPDYQWLPAESVQCAACAVTLASPMQPTQYIVKTLTGRNCIDADTVNVNLTYNEGLVVPNAFSPNGDGHNDIFKPMVLGVYEYHLTIFNRWGNVIFDARSSKLGWDGTFKNQYCDVDSYVYMIEYSYYSNPQKKLLRKGVVALVR